MTEKKRCQKSYGFIYFLSQGGAVLPLLNVCKVRKYNYLRPLALRTLTVICSVQSALEEFEKVNFFIIVINLNKST